LRIPSLQKWHVPSPRVLTALRQQRALQQQRRLLVARLPELTVPIGRSARSLLTVARGVALALAGATCSCSSAQPPGQGPTDAGHGTPTDAAVDASTAADGGAPPLFEDCAAFCPIVDRYPRCSRGTPCSEWCPSVPNKGPATCSPVYDAFLRCVVQANAIVGCSDAGTLEYDACSTQKDALQSCVTAAN
jgi:hypothetical protein